MFALGHAQPFRDLKCSFITFLLRLKEFDDSFYGSHLDILHSRRKGTPKIVQWKTQKNNGTGKNKLIPNTSTGSCSFLQVADLVGPMFPFKRVTIMI